MTDAVVVDLAAELKALRGDLRELIDMLQQDRSIVLGGLERIQQTHAGLVSAITYLGGVLGGIQGTQERGVKWYGLHFTPPPEPPP